MILNHYMMVHLVMIGPMETLATKLFAGIEGPEIRRTCCTWVT